MTREVQDPESPHIIVRASAGSGKTFRLTNEFIGKLFDGEDPAGLLATTFTRVAAGEILHRVLQRLSQGVTDEGERAEMSRFIPGHEITAERSAEVLERLIGQLHRLSILTIDSFFSRLASSHSFELGLPVAYRLLPEDEDNELRERTVDKTISESPIQETVELLRLLQGSGVQTHTHRAIMDIIRSGYAMYLATSGDPAAWTAIKPSGTLMQTGEIDRAVKRLEDVQLPTTKKGEVDKNWIKGLRTTLDTICKREWDTFLKKGFGNSIRVRPEGEEHACFYKKPLPDEIQSELMPIVDHAARVLSDEHYARTISTFRLLQRFDALYTSTKINGGMLNFDDPPRLLNNANITGDLEHLYYRLDSTLRHVLLDEFQDTSMPQFTLLAPILDELFSQNEEGRSVFVVGDVKQSLYAWRQAEPKLLGAMIDRWETLSEQTLSKSWRSSSVVLDAVNRIFDRLPSNIAMVNPKGTDGKDSAKHAESARIGRIAAKSWDDQYDEHEAAKELPGHVSLRVAERDEESDPDPLSEVLWSCAVSVAEAQAQCPDASIAVLVREGKHIYPLLARLKKLGIDACEDRGNPLVDSPCVAAAVSMLTLIEHPGNSAALYHVRSSPLGNALGILSSKQIHSIASRMRSQTMEEGCVPMLCEWLALTADSMDVRGHTRFKQLIQLAGTLQEEGRPDPTTLARVAQERRIDEPGQSPVRVITIHRSKGLEFDVVVMPLLDKKWQVRSGSLLSQREEPLDPISKVSIAPNEILRSIHPELKSIHEHALLQQVNEELCCLYVAMTRAKRSLQMILAEDKNGRENIAPSNLSLCPAHIVHAAMAKDIPCVQGTVLYEDTTDDPWYSGLVSKTESEQTQPNHRSISLKTRSAKQVSSGQLKSVAPSSIHTDSPINASSLLESSPVGEYSRKFGLCVHACYEFIDWIDENPIDQRELASKLSDLGYPDSIVADSVLEVNQSLDNTGVQRLLQKASWIEDHPDASTCTVHHEHPFAARLLIDGNERLVQGRFDRLVLGWTSDSPPRVCCAQVIDYKTDRVAIGLDDSQLAQLASQHQAQMDAYRQAVAKLYRLDDDQIEVALLYTKSPGIAMLGSQSLDS
ncbi:MAG: UvrD-helicase domain-containing protein [Phycisphaerales bacterium]